MSKFHKSIPRDLRLPNFATISLGLTSPNPAPVIPKVDFLRRPSELEPLVGVIKKSTFRSPLLVPESYIGYFFSRLSHPCAKFSSLQGTLGAGAQ